jgi:hypothetical protein
MFVRRQATALVLFRYEHNRATAFPPCEMSSLQPKGTSIKTIICLLYKVGMTATLGEQKTVALQRSFNVEDF